MSACRSSLHKSISTEKARVPFSETTNSISPGRVSPLGCVPRERHGCLARALGAGRRRGQKATSQLKENDGKTSDDPRRETLDLRLGVDPEPGSRFSRVLARGNGDAQARRVAGACGAATSCQL